MSVTHLDDLDGKTWNAYFAKHSPCIVKCSTAWCGPCKAIAPKYEQLAGEHKGVTFFAVDIEEVEPPAELQVTGVPTFLYYAKGERDTTHNRIVGGDKKKLEAWIAKVLAD